MVYIKCMLVIGLMPWKPFACIISENIDPRYLGLYINHRMLYYTKPISGLRAYAWFSIILDANCLKNRIFGCLDSGLVKSTDRLIEQHTFYLGLAKSKYKSDQLAELVHVLSELVLQSAVFRLLSLELHQEHYPKLFLNL